MKIGIQSDLMRQEAALDSMDVVEGVLEEVLNVGGVEISITLTEIGEDCRLRVRTEYRSKVLVITDLGT